MTKNICELDIRGSTNDELEQELSHIYADIRHEFQRYHQREFRGHDSTAWFIRWLMRDEEPEASVPRQDKSSVRGKRRR